MSTSQDAVLADMLRSGVTAKWLPLKVSEVRVGARQRQLSNEHVAELQRSFERLGGQLQLQPIVVDETLTLVDGAHRLEAAKLAGWVHISAVVVEGIDESQRALIEVEANRARMDLTPVELEAAWRVHYEPELKARARTRQLAGLRRGKVAAPVTDEHGGQAHSLSIAASARSITGLSLGTLNKISTIRRLSESVEEPEEVQEAAKQAMRKLASSKTSISSVHREVFALRRQLRVCEELDLDHARRLEGEFEQMFHDVGEISRRLTRTISRSVGSMADAHSASQHLLCAVRVALNEAAATAMALECLQQVDARSALQQIGGEMDSLQARIAAEKIELGAKARHEKK